MAEIKSTMEKVMERIAGLGVASRAELDAEENIKKGMRLAAEYLRGDNIDLTQGMTQVPAAELPAVSKGLLQALLRNIVLPRNDQQRQLAEKAIEGVLQLGKKASDLVAVVHDMRTIIDHYHKKKEQVYKQLETGFSQQAQYMQQAMAQQTGMKMRVDASQLPKFQEEWQRVQASLNDQYGRVLEQHKELLAQRLGQA